MSPPATGSTIEGWYSPAFFADPYPYYRALREQEPVHWSETLNGWVITAYDPMVSVLQRPGEFCNAGRMAALLDQLPQEDRASFQPSYDHFAVGMIRCDPPDHTRLRRLVGAAFTPRVIRESRERIQAIVDELIDVFPRAKGVDLVEAFAFPLPATVICSILGVPAGDIGRVRDWTAGINAIVAGHLPLRQAAEQMQAALLELRHYYGEMIKDRRRSPRDDLMGRLVAAESEGDRMTEPELLSTAENLLAAGHETTTALIANGIVTLLDHPEQWRQLQESPDLLPAAIEEILRYESPLQRQTRVVKRDAEVVGCTLRAGDVVYILPGAANRDPDVFPDPDQFDIHRPKPRHLAFGFGIHFCIGAALARMEAELALGALIERFPGMRRIGDGVTWARTAAVRVPAALPMRLGPGAGPVESAP